jgi:PAS domain S-box-containing protein
MISLPAPCDKTITGSAKPFIPRRVVNPNLIVENANDCIISINSEGDVVGWNRKAEALFGYPKHEVEGRPVSLVIPDLSVIDAALAESTAPAVMTGVKRGKIEFPIELSVGSYLDGTKSFHTLIARDVSERQERDEFISEALRMAKSPTRKEYLDSVVRLVQIWSGCSCVGIRILAEDGTMPFESFVGFNEEFWEWESWLSTTDDCCICTRIITGTTESQDAAITTEDGSFRTDNMDRFLSGLSANDRLRFRGNCPKYGYLSIAFTPIQYRGRVFGGLHITDEREAMLPPRKVRFIESIATHIGQALYRMEVEEALQESHGRQRQLAAHLESVREEERLKISREVHDELGQMMTVLKFDISFLKETEALPPPVARKLADMDANVTATLRAVQRISAELRPKLLDDLGLVPAIEWQIKDFAQRTGIACSHKMPRSLPPLAPECSTAIFRILKEALTNVQRHAEASKVSVKLRRLKQEIVLIITDNGKGIGSGEILGKDSFGLMGMRERALLCFGEIGIEGKPGEGTTVTLRIPVIKAKSATKGA